MLSSQRYDSPRGHQGASSLSYISRRLLPCGDTMSHLEGRGQSWLCSRNCHPGGLNLPSTAAPAPAGARGREHSSQHPTRGWLPLSASGEAPEARDKLSREKKPPNPALPLPLTHGWVPRGSGTCPRHTDGVLQFRQRGPRQGKSTGEVSPQFALLPVPSQSPLKFREGRLPLAVPSDRLAGDLIRLQLRHAGHTSPVPWQEVVLARVINPEAP